MSSIYDWSLTAANNGTADALINFAEGQAPSTVNNSAREVMARVAEILADQGGALTAAGTANALTVTTNSPFTAYADGLMIALRIATDNSAAATLNVNGIGAKSIRKMVAAGETALTGAELQATGIYILKYSTALNSAAGGWLLLNPTIDLTPYATLASPTFTGNPTAPTPIAGDNDTSIATTAFVTGGIATAIAALSSVYQAASARLTALVAMGTAVAGDIIYASGADTWARLGKGTARQSLLMNAGATAPAWTTLPFSQSYDSGQQTITAAGSLTLAHGLGSAPKLYLVAAQCVTAQNGYSIGDEVLINPSQHDTATTDTGIVVTSDATNIFIRFGNSANSFHMLHKTSGNSGGVTFTNANWKLVVRAWA